MKEFKSFYKTVGGNEGSKCKYPTRLDTYGCGCYHDCTYCVSGETEILMYDGSIKLMRDIEIGDEIYGVKIDNEYHTFTKSVVLNKWAVEKPSYKITLENGVELICSAEHRWLTDRGWKYTIGEMSGKNQRPYLTTNNLLRGFSCYAANSRYVETDDYKRGYLCGMIKGDGNLTDYDYSGNRRGFERQYHFRLALKEKDGVLRTKRYLSDFGVDTNEFIFKMKDRKTKEILNTVAIRTHKKENYDKIKDLINITEWNDELLRGFVAGFYDAEGCKDIYIKRVYNTDEKLIEIYELAMKTFGFTTVRDKNKTTVSGKTLYTIRHKGNVGEVFRFTQVFNPSIKANFNFDGVSLKSIGGGGLRVKSIEPYKDTQSLYDITTTTENFIANGVVSHNCYAKSLLEFRGLWNADEPAVADIKKIENKIKKLPKGTILRLGGMTDCFQPCELEYRNTYKTIELCNKYGIGYLIVTKSHIVANDEYLSLMDKDLAHIQITVTTLDDKKSLEYERASVPSKRVEAIKKLQDAGFDVAIRLSPIIPEFMDFDKLNELGIKKAVVEFLRVNHWIKKWFDIDYSKYSLKESGYNHLPLEDKIEILNRIQIPNKTICEDVTEHYEYWRDNVNPNKDDCCNLCKGD